MAKQESKKCPLCKRKYRDKTYGSKTVKEPAIVKVRPDEKKSKSYHCKACGGFFEEK